MNTNIPVMDVNKPNPFQKKNGDKQKPNFIPPAPPKPEFYQLLVPVRVGDGERWFLAEQYFDRKGNMIGIEPRADELKGMIQFRADGQGILLIDEKHRYYEARMTEVEGSHLLLNGTPTPNGRTKIVTQTVQVPVHYLTSFQKFLYGFLIISTLVLAFIVAQGM